MGIDANETKIHALAHCIAKATETAPNLRNRNRGPLHGPPHGPLRQRIYPTLDIMVWKWTYPEDPTDILIFIHAAKGWSAEIHISRRDTYESLYRVHGVHCSCAGLLRTVTPCLRVVNPILKSLATCVVRLLNAPVLEARRLNFHMKLKLHELKLLKKPSVRWPLRMWAAKAEAHPQGARAQANMRNTLNTLNTLKTLKTLNTLNTLRNIRGA